MSSGQLKLISRQFAGFEKSFAVQTDAFAADHPGWTVSREFIPIEHLEKRMVSGHEAAEGSYDLFLCNTDWLPQVIRDKGLLPLNRFLEENPPDGWPDGWSDSMKALQTDAEGNIYGIAYHDGPEMFIYRHDLFGDLKEKAAFLERYGYPLEVPVTWKQFLDVAAFFTRPAEGLYGAVAAGLPDGHNNVYDFLIHLWSRGGELVNEQWEPVFHDAIGLEALQFYVDLYNSRQVFPQEAKQLDSVGAGDYYASGRAAMMWNWCGFAGVAEVPELSRIVGKTSTGLIPKGEGPGGRHISLNIYWVLGIPAGSRQPEAAYQFIRHCASEAMDMATSVSGGNGTRLSTWRSEKLISQFPYYRSIETVHANVRSTLAIPEYPEINEVLNAMVDNAIHDRMPAREALNDAAAVIRGILLEAGYIRSGRQSVE